MYISYIYSNYFIYGGDKVDIIISNSSPKPIYEQIASQIKNLILNGTLKEGELLPSMRLLAKELRISVITTKRAYEELEFSGFIETVTGKGSFVAGKNLDLIREEQLKMAEQHIQQAVDIAKSSGIKFEELLDILKIIYGDDE